MPALTEEAVGKVARRIRFSRGRERFAGLAHVIDSVVADSVVTACGKRMQRKVGSGELRITELDDELSINCWPCAAIYRRRP